MVARYSKYSRGIARRYSEQEKPEILHISLLSTIFISDKQEDNFLKYEVRRMKDKEVRENGEKRDDTRSSDVRKIIDYLNLCKHITIVYALEN